MTDTDAHGASGPTPELPRAGRRASSIVRRLLRARLGAFGLVTVTVMVLVALFADVLAPHDPNRQIYTSILQPPSVAHPLGTDNLGRDVLSRIMFGSRISLLVGLSSVAFATVLGSLIGLIAGYSRGLFDEIAMRVMDALYSFPAILLALAITAALGPGIVNVIVAIGIVYTPIFARLTRGQVLSVRERDFVTAAKGLGASDSRVVTRHVWPNVTAAIIVQSSLSVSFAIIVEASLSFLGIGVQPPTASWGAMLRTGYGYLEIGWWLSVFPGAIIFLTVLALNVLGDALRDVLDPRLTGSGGR
jgi:peptide/nickel transport system permease protein